MPYIKKKDRLMFDYRLAHLAKSIRNEGDFNYCITKLALLLLEKWGRKYKIFNLLIGVMECSKIELYRMYVAPYEDEKIEENGGLS